jgi:acetylornithine aminotransferase
VGGVQLMTPQFAQSLEYFCHRHGAMLICDEVQCGYGRSGKFFAHQHLGIKPDIITVAKGIANGFPMGGVLISPDFEANKGQLGTTFGGNHLACAAALAVLDVYEQQHLVENAAEVGEYLLSALRSVSSNTAAAYQTKIKEIRGRGLMIGIEFDGPQKPVRDRLLKEQHVFTGASGDYTLRLLPPLTLTKEQADDFVERFKQVL